MSNTRINHETRRQLIDLLERLGGGLAAQGTGWEDSLTEGEIGFINASFYSSLLSLDGCEDTVLDAMNRHHRRCAYYRGDERAYACDCV